MGLGLYTITWMLILMYGGTGWDIIPTGVIAWAVVYSGGRRGYGKKEREAVPTVRTVDD